MGVAGGGVMALTIFLEKSRIAKSLRAVIAPPAPSSHRKVRQVSSSSGNSAPWGEDIGCTKAQASFAAAHLHDFVDFVSAASFVSTLLVRVSPRLNPPIAPSIGQQ